MEKSDSQVKIEAILKATETIRNAPAAAVERWGKLDKLKVLNVKKNSLQYQLTDDYFDLDVAQDMKCTMGENGSGIYMGTI